MKVALTTLNSKYIHPNLALRWLYVARDKKHETEIFEFTIKDDLNRCTEKLKVYQPDIIGISCYIWNGEYIEKWVKLIKSAMPEVKIVLGGPEVSFESQRYLFDDVDGIFRGEGEQAFWKYVNGEKDIEGFFSRDYISEISYSKTDVRILEELESPYFLDIDSNSKNNRYLYVETSRGCPYQCSYCLASLDNKVRDFSLEYLFDLFDRLKDTDIKQVKFLDRTFNYNPQRSMAIARKLLTMPESISFQFEIMADQLSDEMIQLIVSNPVKSRFRFEVGLQSFNCDALQAVGRRQNLDRLCENVRLLRKNQTIVHVDLIAGLPYEDLNSFKQTYQKLFSLDASEMQVGILKLLHGSKLYYQMDKFAIKAEKNSPYQIINNSWISENDIEAVEMVAMATERLWNKDYCKNALWYLFEQNYPMFDYMCVVGKEISRLTRPYQPHQIFEIMDNSLDDDYFKLLLLDDYYRLFKQRPVRYHHNNLDKKMKHQIFTVLEKDGIIKEKDLRYCLFDNSSKGYQVVLYNNDSRYPQRFFVNKEMKYVGKEDLNERHNDCHLK